MYWDYGGYPRYVPVAERRAEALLQMEKLRKRGKVIEPVKIEGRTIARSFWGKGWCEHLESFSDFENRLPRGRTYVRNGSVCHLEVKPGQLEAMVSGSSLYTVKISITKIQAKVWQNIKQRCAGQVGSMLELLQGKLSDRVMAVVADHDAGLFPKPNQIKLECSCPDWATMCKHVAAVLYGVGSRLDKQPELLFTLRGVDPQELITADLTLPGDADTGAQTLADEQISDVFGIDLDDTVSQSPSRKGADSKPKKAKRTAKTRRAGGATGASSDSSGPSESAPQRKGRRAKSSNQVKAKPVNQRPRPNLRPTCKSVTRLRRQSGLTQSQFAEKLGVSPASVARWETTSGRLNLRKRCLEALVDLKFEIGGR